MHHTFSPQLTAPSVATWNRTGRADHDITRVESGIAADALTPREGAALTARILAELFRTGDR